MDKPDVDSIEGLSPAISIDQKTTSRNPRSTVGTVTEIYDYLRLLWARIGHPHCHSCGAPIAGQSVEQIVDHVMTLDEGTRFMVLAPVIRGRKGEYKDLLEELRSEGYTRAKIDGELRRLEDEIDLDKKYKHDIAVVVDRLQMKPDVRKRLADSVETAVALAEGIVEVEAVVDEADGRVARSPSRTATGAKGVRESAGTLVFSEKFSCLNCGTSMPELEPRIFSFNSPHGACPRCTGLGSKMEIDPDLVVDPSLSINEGAILPWSSGADYYEQLAQAIGEKYGIDLDVPWEDLAEEDQELFLFGEEGERVYVSYRNRMGRKRSYMAPLEGVVTSLERRYLETDSEYSRERIEEYMSVRPCPECDGARLRPETLAVKVGGLGIHEFTRKSAREAIEWLDDLKLGGAEQQIASRIMKEIVERLQFLDAVGVGYLTLERAAATLSGGEAQRIRLATQIGSSLVGRALHPRRALDRAAPARQPQAARHAEAAARPRQHRDRRGARRGHDAGRGPHRRPRPRRRGARRPRDRRGNAREGEAGYAVAHRPVPGRQAADRRSRRAAQAPGIDPDPGRGAAQPEGHRRRVSARGVRLRDGRVGLGQVHARQRDPVPRGRQPAAPREAAPRQAPQGEGNGQDRQDHQHRPVADRAHAALEPGHLHRACSTTSASCTRARRSPAPAATSAAGSRST